MEKIVTSASSRSFTIAVSLIFVTIGALVSYLLNVNGLGPIDDHQLIRTVFQDIEFEGYILPELGRFIPFTAQEYGLVSKIISPSASLFYFLNVIKVLAGGVLLVRCLVLITKEGTVLAIFWLFAFLSIGMANSMFRLHVGELNIFVLTTIFLWAVIERNAAPFRSEKPSNNLLLAAGLISILTSFFYKEIAFVIPLVYSFLEIFRLKRQQSKVSRHLVLLLAMSLAYVVFYVSWRAMYVTGSYATMHTQELWRTLQNYRSNDPVFLFIVLPLVLYRGLVIFRFPDRHNIYDSILISGAAYFFTYLALGMFNTYYLIPAYGFAACGIAGLVSGTMNRVVGRIVLGITALLVANNAPAAISDMQALKQISNNHWSFVHFLSDWVSQDYSPAKPLNVVLVGVSPASGIEVLHSLKTYLVSLGISEKAFNVFATEPVNNAAIASYYQVGADQIRKGAAGDMLIFNPYQSVSRHPPANSSSYTTIYRSEDPWSLPRWNLVRWLGACKFGVAKCSIEVGMNRRYVGYAAIRQNRDIEAVTAGIPLHAPSFIFGNIAVPDMMHAKSVKNLKVALRNSGKESWPANGTLQGQQLVHLAYRWFDADGHLVLEGNRTPFPGSMEAGDSIDVLIDIQTPERKGQYVLDISPVQEGVRWFESPRKFNVQIN